MRTCANGCQRPIHGHGLCQTCRERKRREKFTGEAAKVPPPQRASIIVDVVRQRPGVRIGDIANALNVPCGCVIRGLPHTSELCEDDNGKLYLIEDAA